MEIVNCILIVAVGFVVAIYANKAVDNAGKKKGGVCQNVC